MCVCVCVFSPVFPELAAHEHLLDFWKYLISKNNVSGSWQVECVGVVNEMGGAGMNAFHQTKQAKAL